MKPKKKENFYQDFQKEILDPISPSFCAAKWLNSTIWLGNGTTSSCHLPPPHSIPTEGLAQNPSALHNTVHKKIARSEMLEGKRPSECEYCWKIEDLKKNNLSDRVFKSAAFSTQDIQRISELSFDTDVDPRTLEIAFDRTCNFACSYCSAAQSTKWAVDIDQHGKYQNIYTEAIYATNGDWAEPFQKKENPYLNAFWEWWPKLSSELEELRVTGGEPLLSKETWKLFDTFSENKKIKTRLAINTNLGHSKVMIQKLVEKSKLVPELDLYISCESTDERAEYIRDGLEYKRFVQNIESLMKEAQYRQLHMMMTITSLSVLDMTSFLDQLVVWKEMYGERAPRWTCNILRFPAFMSVAVLPREVKKSSIQRLQKWLSLNQNNQQISALELESVKRLINYLDEVNLPYSQSKQLSILRHDFKSFFDQYDKRRGKSLIKSFPELKAWFNKIRVIEGLKMPIVKKINSVDWYHNYDQLKKKAKSKGLKYPTKKEVTND